MAIALSALTDCECQPSSGETAREVASRKPPRPPKAPTPMAVPEASDTAELRISEDLLQLAESEPKAALGQIVLALDSDDIPQVQRAAMLTLASDIADSHPRTRELLRGPVTRELTTLTKRRPRVLTPSVGEHVLSTYRAFLAAEAPAHETLERTSALVRALGGTGLDHRVYGLFAARHPKSALELAYALFDHVDPPDELRPPDFESFEAEESMWWSARNPTDQTGARPDAPIRVERLPLSSIHRSGVSEYLRVDADGRASLQRRRRALENGYFIITLGRTDNELVAYDRLRGILEVGIVHPGGGFQPVETVTGMPTVWDLGARGDFSSARGKELVFYDRQSGTVSVRESKPGWPELLQGEVGSTWTALALGRWAGMTRDELALYDRAGGRLCFWRADSAGMSLAACAEDVVHNDEHLVALRLDGPGSPASLMFYNVDNGVGRIVDVDSDHGLVERQRLHGPSSEAVLPLSGEFGGGRGEDLLLYDQSAGRTELWVASDTGRLERRTTAGWGHSWTHLVAPRQPDETHSDIYRYTNMVTVIVSFVRMNDDHGTLAFSFGEDADPRLRSATRTIAWLNRSYHPAGVHFELGQIHDLRRSLLLSHPACVSCDGGCEDYLAAHRRYASWLSRSSCATCVQSHAPGCGWGVAEPGTASCDDAAVEACAEACPVADFDRCDDETGRGPLGCLSATMSPDYEGYCRDHCPPPQADRLLLTVLPSRSTLACSDRVMQVVYMRQGSYDDQYFPIHEVGHYLGLPHSHLAHAPTSADPWAHSAFNPKWQRIEGVDDTVAMFHSRFFDVLGVPDVCDDTAGISIPDSGDCLIAHGGPGCAKHVCASCVTAQREGCRNSWDQQCVSLASSACAASCDQTATHFFVPQRHNPMAYGSGACSAQSGIYRFTASQLRRARELLFVARPGLIEPTPLWQRRCMQTLPCPAGRSPADTDWDGCPDTCQCPRLCSKLASPIDEDDDGCPERCELVERPQDTMIPCTAANTPVDSNGDGRPEACMIPD